MTVLRTTVLALLGTTCLAAPANAWPWDSKPKPAQVPTSAECRDKNGNWARAVAPGGKATAHCASPQPQVPVLQQAPAQRPATAATEPPKPAAVAPPPKETPKPKPRKLKVRTVRTIDACTPLNGGKPFTWRVSGGDKFASSQSEAFSDGKLDLMLRCNQVPSQHWDAIKRHLRGDVPTSVTIMPGDFVGDMMSGSGIYRDVTSGLPGPQLALRYEFDAGGVHYVFLLPLECWNWIKAPAPKRPDCDLIVFETRRVGEIPHIPAAIPAGSEKCHGYVSVAIEGNHFKVTSGPIDLSPGCFGAGWQCSFAGFDRVVAPRKRNFHGSIKNLQPGMYALLVDPKNTVNPATAIGICVLYNVGNGPPTSSETAIVTDRDYALMPDGSRAARVFYSKSELPAGLTLDGPGYLYTWKQ